MSSTELFEAVVHEEMQRQLLDHFIEKAIMCQLSEVEELNQMILEELPSLIQSGVHDVIQVFMDARKGQN